MTVPFQRLLLATEHSVYDGGAETLAFALARERGLPLTAVLPVAGNDEFDAVAPLLAARVDAEAALKRQSLEATARMHKVDLEVVVRHGSEPFAEIVAEARERSSDLIVIRRRGRRGLLANLLMGEMVGKVVGHAPCSVLIAPRGAQLWRRAVLVGVDPRGGAAPAVRLAAAVAASHDVPLHLLSLADTDAERARAQQALDEALAMARTLVPGAAGQVRPGRPHSALVDAARSSGADLLVVARRGDESLVHAWIGGTAQKVIGTAECAVLVCINPEPST